ncbi:MAG: beta-phosphoglucomutase [Chloroflexi bacterium]|nr:beta-phosphoglucomutase [Chloroflexota bacterium]
MAIKAFIFDLDGVITDTVEYHFLSWKRVTDEEGIPFTREENEHLRGLSRREALNRILKGRPVDETVAQQWMTRKNDYYLAYVERFTSADRLPGVTETLETARDAGLRLAVASSSMNARLVLEKLDLLEMFAVVGDAYSVANTKPAPDVFIWAAGGLNVSVAEAVVFEDAEAGVEAALAAGCWTVGLGNAGVQRAHRVYAGLHEVQVSEILSQFATPQLTHE